TMIMRTSWQHPAGPTRMMCRLRQQARDWLYRAALGEHLAGERGFLDSQVVPQQALEHGAQIGGRLEVALLVQVRFLEAGPVGDNTAALERAASQQRHRAGAVIGPVGAVDARGAAELGDDRDDALAPRVAHIGLDRRY